MLTNLIESRGKEFSNLIKIGDYLARSLRENVELFYVDSGKVTYVTESGGVIAANYKFKPYLSLSNIEIEDSSILEDVESFEKITNKKVSTLLSNLLESDYHEAENEFDEILNLFETKLSFDRIKQRLKSKVERFGEQTKIVSSVQFKKISEIKDKIVSFLKENKNIINIPEIRNGLKLASVVSKSFNIPKITLQELAETKTFSVKSLDNTSIYDHLCRQELIAKELLEAKENFDTTWANNELICDLASMIFEKRSKIEEKVAEVIAKIPYFALATKKQISNIIENSLGLSEVKVSSKDISSFVSKIFEMKKPVKDYVINILNEKYGINVNNLNDIPTFSNLIKTEMVILTSLAKLAPKNSVVKQTLIDFAESLKIKNGSECIDVVDFLNEIFSEAGFKNELNETSLLQYLDFAQVADDLGKIGTILKMLKPVLAGGGDQQSVPPVGGGIDGLPGTVPQQKAPDIIPDAEEGDEEETPEGMPEEIPEEGQEEDMPGSQAEEAADEVMDEEVPDAEEQAPVEEMPEDNGEAESSMDTTTDEINDLVSKIEDLLSSIKGEMGDSEEGNEDEEMPEEEMVNDEGDEDEDSEYEEGTEEDEEEEKNKFPKK